MKLGKLSHVNLREQWPVEAKGFSIRTGIKGLYFCQSWGKGSNGAIIGMIR